MEGNIQKRYTI